MYFAPLLNKSSRGVAWGEVGRLNRHMAQSGAKWQSDEEGPQGSPAPVFIGESRHPVDPKNRVFLPKRFQAGLPLDDEGNRAGVLMRGLDGCIFLFTKEGHRKATSMVNMEAFASREQRSRQRALLRSGHEFTLDASGRLLLPAPLIKLAGIERDVVQVGVGGRVEIWSADRWDAMEAETEAAFEEFENHITGKSGGQGG